MTNRDYNSPTREQAKAETRERILDAVVKVVLDDGVHAFTVQNVAKKAGVSHRTVYRHFETREALLDGLSDSVDAFVSATGLPSMPDAFTDASMVADIIEPTFQRFGQLEDRVRAYVVIAIALDRPGEDWKARSKAFEAVLVRSYPNVDRQVVHEAYLAARALASSRGWFVLTHDLGADSATAGRAASRALRALFDQLRTLDNAEK